MADSAMPLPPADAAYLASLDLHHTIVVENEMICVILPAFPLPPGYDRSHSDLLLRLSPGYPDIAPDMWWFDPPLKRANGSSVPATEVHESHAGRRWQRWSRHFRPGQWRSGIDCLETLLALVRKELQRQIGAAA